MHTLATFFDLILMKLKSMMLMAAAASRIEMIIRAYNVRHVQLADRLSKTSVNKCPPVLTLAPPALWTESTITPQPIDPSLASLSADQVLLHLT